MIEHCISAFQERQDIKAYRFYVTDALRIVTENTAHFVKEGILIKSRYADIIDRTAKEPKAEDTRTCEEIASEIWARARIGKRRHDSS